ncbi:MAG: hypothetical protein F6K54_11400 [Okeania sp. SIO3B5]|nr:hypothetical protein [Okeania sp. SIO3B5]
MPDNFPRYLLFLEGSRYFLKSSDRLLLPINFLQVFLRYENFTSIY